MGATTGGNPLVSVIATSAAMPGACTEMLYVPSVELAVAIVLAVPVRSVTTVVAASVADAPAMEATNVTGTQGIGSPPASRITALIDCENEEPGAAVCPPPPNVADVTLPAPIPLQLMS